MCVRGVARGGAIAFAVRALYCFAALVAHLPIKKPREKEDGFGIVINKCERRENSGVRKNFERPESDRASLVFLGSFSPPFPRKIIKI